MMTDRRRRGPDPAGESPPDGDDGSRATLELQAHLAAVLQCSHDGIVSVDETGIVRVFNEGAQTIFGWTAEEVVGQPIDLLIPEAARWAHRGHVARFSRDATRTRAMQQLRDVSGRRKNGKTFTAEITVSKTSVGGEILFTAFVRDTSERHELQAKYLLARQLEAVGRLAAGVVHDLNTILSTIALNVQLLRVQTPASEDESWSVIEGALARGRSFAEQLLAIARRGSERRDDSVYYEPAEVVRAIEPLLRRMVRGEVGVKVRVHDEGDVLWGEPTRLEQAIMNLVANASEASLPGGRIEVDLRRRTLVVPEAAHHAVAPAGTYVSLRVSDQGPGIPSDRLERVFEPFYTTKARHGGSGLGLPTVLDVVNEHAGYVRVEIRPGLGARFELLLPLAELPSRPEGREQRL